MFINTIFFITFLLSLALINSELNIINLTFVDENLILENLNESIYYFYLSFNKNASIPDYIQILINIAKDDYKNEYFISYYDKDSSFINRKKSSQLSRSTAFLSLKRQQIKNGFYFKVEVKKMISKQTFTLYINPENYILLTPIYSTYNYHVTEKYKSLNFIIALEKEKVSTKKSKIVVWAYGNKKIKTDLNILYTSYLEKHSKYNAYIMEQNEYNNYILTVNAEENDFINVGFIILVQDGYSLINICTNCYKKYNIYKGFLKKNILENICFYDYFQDYKEISKLHIKYIDTEIDINYDIKSKYTEPKIKYVCVNLPNTFEELFFSFHYMYNYDLNNYLYNSLLKGIYYDKELYYTRGFLPLRIEDDFEYLTYYIVSYLIPNQKLNIYFAICEDYPLCTKTKKDYKINNNITINQYFNTYTITLNRNHFKQIYPDPTEKKRLFLCTECLEKEGKCYFYINIYSDKTKIYQGTEINKFFDSNDLKLKEFPNEPNLQYKFIKSNMINNILIKPKNDFGFQADNYINPFFIFEKINGDMTINTDKNFINSFNNINNYKLNSLDDYINIKIKANKDSLYRINYYHSFYGTKNNEIRYYIYFGGNYLIDLKNDYNTIIKFYHRNYDEFSNQILTYIYPINCEIMVREDLSELRFKKYHIEDIREIRLKKYHINNITFFQKISWMYFDYKITNINKMNNNNSCMVYISSYIYNNDIYNKHPDVNDFDRAFVLSDNVPYYYVFNNEFNELFYSYYFVRNKIKNINININLLNKGEFILRIDINNNIFYKEYNIKSDAKIIITKQEFEQKCSLNNEIFKLYFKIINNKNNNNEDSYIKILINTEDNKNNTNTENNKNIINIENNKKNTNKENNKNNNYSSIIFIFILSLFLLGIVIIYERKKPNTKEIDNDIKGKELEEMFNN